MCCISFPHISHCLAVVLCVASIHCYLQLPHQILFHSTLQVWKAPQHSPPDFHPETNGCMLHPDHTRPPQCLWGLQHTCTVQNIIHNFPIINEYNIFWLIKINDHSVNSGDTPMIRAGPVLPEYSNTRLCEHHHRNAIAFQPSVTPNWCCMLITGWYVWVLPKDCNNG